MAEDSWPKSTRNGGTITDYEHEQLVAPTQHSGLIGQPTDPTLVYADSTGLQFKVRANRYGIVRAKEWFSGPTEYTKTITANSSGATRIDLVVLRWDRATNAVTLEVRQGTPGQARPAPVQQTPPATTWGTGIWELPIAQVTVINGASTIAAADVVNLAWYISPDGLILCTDTTRPYGATLYAGLQIYETNTDRMLVWNDSIWAPASPYVCTSTTRPGSAARWTGMQIYETDTDLTWVWDGAAWDPLTTMVVCTSTARPTGNALFTGLQIYETDTDLVRVWDGAAWDPVITAVVCTSTTRPTGNALFTGLQIYETDTTLTYRWNGAAWQITTRGVLGGTRWTGGGNLVTGLTTTELVVMTAAAVALPPSALIEVSAGVRLLATVVNDVWILRVREGSATGTLRAEYTWAAPNASAGFNEFFKGRFETSGAVTTTFVVTAVRASGTGQLTMIAGGAQHNTHLTASVLAQTGKVAVAATP